MGQRVSCHQHDSARGAALRLNRAVATSSEIDKLPNFYTLLPSSVSCVQVSSHSSAELSDGEKETLNPGHRANESRRRAAAAERDGHPVGSATACGCQLQFAGTRSCPRAEELSHLRL